MSEIDLARPHVVRCLQYLWDVERVRPDADGDYPYRTGTAACYIGLDDGEPTVVKAVALAVVNVKKSTRLLAKLNDVNAHCWTAHFHWVGGAVIVEQTVLANSLDRRSLTYAGQSVAQVAMTSAP
jgi:hypothetical protein